MSKRPQKLVDWFLREQRVLPWRDNPSPYRVWVSEIMLQQTQVKTVMPYFERFMERFPTVEKLAKSPPEKVLQAWAGLGYYSRARNLHSAAKLIVQGGFPESLDGWLALPGVGRYTAGAVLSIAYGQPTAILDGNVERVLSRWLMIPRGDSDSEYRARLWKESQTALDGAVEDVKNPGVGTKKIAISPSDFNQALMELGAMICSPKKPACSICPVRRDCSAFAAGRVDEFPSPKKKKVWEEVREERIGILNSRGKVLLQLVGADAKWRKGLWDFPSASDLDVGILRGLKPWFTEAVKYVVTKHKVKRKMKWVRGGVKISGTKFRWVNPREEIKVPIGAPAKKALQAITKRYTSLGK